MMKEIEANIAILKDRVEKMRNSQDVAECLYMQGAMLERLVKTLELFYKLVTQ